MKILICIFSIVLLFACNQKENSKQKHNLKIAIKTNYKQFLWYPTINRQAIDSSYYDSLHDLSISHFDSLKNGKIQVYIFSLLTDDFERKFDLKEDITISFDTTQYSKFTLITDYKKFRQLVESSNDTLFISRKIVGCFGGRAEKLKIYKTQISYKIEYSNSGEKSSYYTDNFYKSHLNKFLDSYEKLFTETINTQMLSGMSTTKINTYIRLGNTILELPDFYDWKGYENFKNDIGVFP